jgi:GNAT superfamily N-acetyltransferase
MIRAAKQSDVEPMMKLCDKMWNESRYRKLFTFDRAKTKRALQGLIADKGGIVFVDEEAGTITGMIWAFVEPHFFTKEVRSYDVLLYVDPEHRRGTAGMQLIQAYVAKARALGAVEVMMGTTTNDQPDKAVRLFEAAGFKRVGGVFAQ